MIDPKLWSNNGNISNRNSFRIIKSDSMPCKWVSEPWKRMTAVKGFILGNFVLTIFVQCINLFPASNRYMYVAEMDHHWLRCLVACRPLPTQQWWLRISCTPMSMLQWTNIETKLVSFTKLHSKLFSVSLASCCPGRVELIKSHI